MNVAKQIGKLRSTSAPSRLRKCTPKKVHDEELGIDIKVCREDPPTKRQPIKRKKRKSASCKQYRWSDTKDGRQCVCSSTGKRAADRYCQRKKAR